MPTRHRPERRIDYRHFPPSYTELIERFERTGSVRLGPMTHRDAVTTRHRLNRFFGYLRNADPGDDYARALYDIASTMTSTLITDDNGDHWLVWSLDPVVAMLPQRSKS